MQRNEELLRANTALSEKTDSLERANAALNVKTDSLDSANQELVVNNDSLTEALHALQDAQQSPEPKPLPPPTPSQTPEEPTGVRWSAWDVPAFDSQYARMQLATFGDVLPLLVGLFVVVRSFSFFTRPFVLRRSN